MWWDNEGKRAGEKLEKTRAMNKMNHSHKAKTMPKVVIIIMIHETVIRLEVISKGRRASSDIGKCE